MKRSPATARASTTSWLLRISHAYWLGRGYDWSDGTAGERAYLDDASLLGELDVGLEVDVPREVEVQDPDIRHTCTTTDTVPLHGCRDLRPLVVMYVMMAPGLAPLCSPAGMVNLVSVGLLSCVLVKKPPLHRSRAPRRSFKPTS